MSIRSPASDSWEDAPAPLVLDWTRLDVETGEACDEAGGLDA
jgi:hypothetical protein